MTFKDAAKTYQQIEAEQQEAEERREKLKPRCNAVLASILRESRLHNLEPDDFRRILLALLKNTKFEGAEIKNDGKSHTPSKQYLTSDMYEFGNSQLSYKVWFEKYGSNGSIELHFSQVGRPE